MRVKIVKPAGISLVEVMIVLAISSLLIGIALAAFGQRRGVAVHDATNRVVSEVESVRIEAQKGLGPGNPNAAVGSPDYIASGETLFGEAIEFANNCSGSGTPACMHVYKLKQGYNAAAGRPDGQISSYESYTIAMDENLSFDLNLASDCTTGFSSCVQQNPSSANWSPLANSNALLVIQNSSGTMNFFSPAAAGFASPATTLNPTNYPAQGKARLGLVQLDSAAQDPASAPYKYYLNIDLSGGNDITVSPQ